MLQQITYICIGGKVVEKQKDIFISYRNDGSGNHFACRLCRDLEDNGYSVYFNSNEELEHSFPERLKTAIMNCNDFIVILSSGCIEKLKLNQKIDWVREEILTAYTYQKHIIPILMDGVEMPESDEELPKELSFFPYIDAIKFTEQYIKSPFMLLTDTLKSKNVGKERHKDMFNDNPLYRIDEDYTSTLKEAESGKIKAMYDLGMMCYYGFTDAEGNCANCDYDKAAYWLNKVAQTDNEYTNHAQSTIARMFYQGSFPREAQSYQKAFEYHCKASKSDVFSASDVGFMMRNGIGCNFDFNNILVHYKNNIHNGDDIAVMELAGFLTKYGRFEDAFDLYNSMSYTSPEADYRIGMMYRDGALSDPPKPDYIQAAYYLRNAADNNHIQAAYEYGILCFRPSGKLRRNFSDAEKYLKLAADGGCAGAQYVLGYMYESGHIVKDLKKAIHYLEKAKSQSYSLAALELSKIYQQKECQNFQLAFECAEFAASHGVAEGEFILGVLLLLGRGCDYDINKSYEMLQRAYSHGIFYAKSYLEKIDIIQK